MHSKIGYIKLYRSLIENEIYQLPPLYLRIFERLILEANHQDNEIPYRKKGVVTTKLIKRGEKLTSIRQISEWVGWYERGIFKKPNPKLVKEILDYLVENEMLFIYAKSNRTETHYKIVNYVVYQDKEDMKVTEQKQNRNSLETEKKQLAPQNKNVNNEKNVNNVNKKDIYSTISEIRKLYPGTKSKSTAIRKLPKILKKYSKEEITTTIERYKKYVEWKRENGFKTLNYKNEGTFWNGGYEDYLDENYEEGGNNGYTKPNKESTCEYDFSKYEG